MKPIPVAAAKEIAERFGYHQVVIIARAVGDEANDWKGGGEHVTTYGVDAENCAVAAQVGDFLKFKVMGWANEDTHEDLRYEALTTALQDILAIVGRGGDLEQIEGIASRAIASKTSDGDSA